MKFSASDRYRTIAVLFAMGWSFAGIAQKENKADSAKARICVESLVQGLPLIRTSGAVPIQPKYIPVTGELDYPLAYVLANLGLQTWTPQNIAEATEVESDLRVLSSKDFGSKTADLLNVPLLPQQSHLLSLGEGRSGLVAFAVDQNIEAVGVDKKNASRGNYVGHYLGNYYWTSSSNDARNLKDFSGETQDMVVSHMLLPYLPHGDRLRVLRESFRVLKPGGTARHSILIPDIRRVMGQNAVADYQREEKLVVKIVRELVDLALGDQPHQLAILMGSVSMRFRSDINEAATPVEQIVDTSVTGPVTWDLVRARTAGLEREALNLLIVLGKPGTGSEATSAPTTQQAAVETAAAPVPAAAGSSSWFWWLGF